MVTEFAMAWGVEEQERGLCAGGSVVCGAIAVGGRFGGGREVADRRSRCLGSMCS